MKHTIRLTIVTPTYNQSSFIKDTFESILVQKLPKAMLEYIVVDALSDDGTKEIVESYEEKFRKAGIEFVYIREKDKGQSDAINKGWKRARGEIVTYINSDDFYEKNALDKVLQYFQTHKEIQWAYGGWNLVNKAGKVYQTVKHDRFERNKLLNYSNIGQPSCFFRKKLLEKFGYLDTSLHLAFDYDLWLRFAAKYDAGMIPGVLSDMRYYGEAKSAQKTIPQTYEMLRLGMKYSRFFSWRRLLQYFYFFRGIGVVFFGLDITRRITKAHVQKRDDPKIIALVDPISGGHHEMYLRLYSETLRKLGYTVWIFTCNPDAFKLMTSIRIYRLRNNSLVRSNLPVITFFTEFFRTLGYWRDVRIALQRTEKSVGRKPGLVFFTWLDSQLHPLTPPWFIDLMFPYKWSGLYFHPRHLRIPLTGWKSHIIDPDSVLRAKHCSSVAVLDEGVVGKLSQKLYKPVFVIPDVTDVSTTKTVSPLVKKILHKAGKRKIVGIFGSLDKRKNILEFMDLASGNSAKEYFFLFAGTIQWASFTTDERKKISKFINDPPENSFMIPTFIAHEDRLNALVKICSIVSVLYKDFPHSSNILTKSTYFYKPAIGSHEGCIGDRIEKYGIGVTLKEISPDKIYSGLVFLSRKQYETSTVFKGGCRHFLRDFSFSRLQSSLKSVTSVSSDLFAL